MELHEIDALFVSDSPSEMRLFVATEYARSLSVAFRWHGGPNEDEELILIFEDACVFHLPAILSIDLLRLDSLRLRRCSAQRICQLVPAVSYDESEYASPEGYKVFEFTNASGEPMGYYVAAMGVTGMRRTVPCAA